MTTRPDWCRDTGIRERAHHHCVVCGQANTRGYRLDFHAAENIRKSRDMRGDARCEHILPYAGRD